MKISTPREAENLFFYVDVETQIFNLVDKLYQVIHFL